MSKHQCYRTMWDYISEHTTKKPASEIDRSPWTSPGHPPIDTLPLPSAQLQRAWQARTRQAAQESETDSVSMKIPEFSDLVRSLPSQARDEDDLWTLAEEQKAAGNRRLHSFMLGRRDVAQIMERVEKAEAAPKKVKRKAKSRVEIMEQVVTDGRCSCSVEGRWHTAAEEVVALNGHDHHELQSAILDALEQGRAKQRNIIIVGDTNRAKSFCLKPLALVFRSWAPPDGGSHQLADLSGSEVIWLNEFEFDPTFLSWRKLKDFLEGEPLKVAVPKTQGANYVFDADAPVFGTAPGPVEHPRLQHETDQMQSRIRYFVFTHFFDPASCPDIKPCAVCFCKWVLAARGLPRGLPGPPPRGLAELSRKSRADVPARGLPWFVKKAAGSYAPSDHSGCFRCGGQDHWVSECSMSSQSSSSLGFCTHCGGARADAQHVFCPQCGHKH